MTGASPIEVSIIICTRNRADTLTHTLDSIGRISSPAAWEAIIVDNASTDGTAAVIERYCRDDARFQMLHCTEVGLGAARDTAWQVARGRIVAFSDDDCLLAANYVDALLDAFADNKGAGCVGGRIEQFNPAHILVTIDERTRPSVTAAQTYVPTGSFHGANLSFLTEALRAIGGVDRGLGAGTPFPCEDIDAVARVVWSGYDAVFDPRPSVKHDHRRTEAHRAALTASYDRGRGAYFAKFVFLPGPSSVYRKAWLSRAAGFGYAAELVSLFREIGSAFAYLRAHDKAHLVPFAFLAATLLAIGLPAFVFRVAARRTGFPPLKPQIG